MPRRTLLGALTAAAITAGVMTAPTAEAQDPECDVILPAADRLDAAFNLISADPSPNAGTRVQIAASPLFGLTSPAAIDLRVWSSTVADQLNSANPYHVADLHSDLHQATQKLAEARRYCTS